MFLKLLLKIWPALMPIMVYLFWVFVVEKISAKIFKKKDVIEGEKVVGEKSTSSGKVGIFSLQNRCFVTILYMSLILAILSLVAMGIG
jgi:hypothetical protein